MSGGHKILVVDDDRDLVDSMRTVLESRHYSTDAAHYKAEALEKIANLKSDLILLDIMMERLTDGFDICYQLKHDSELKKIPVLVVSAITEKTGFRFSPETDGEYFAADDYIEKPVKAPDLLERIEKLLN